MKNKLAVAGAVILLAIALYYSVRNARHPADDPALSSIVKPRPLVLSICVEPIQNLSHKPLAMDGVDDQFVAELRKEGFQSRKIADSGAECDATTNAEVVDITGRARKTARIDFRLTLTGQQVPRMSSSVEGKSLGKSKDLSDFIVNPEPKEEASAEREAIVIALTKSAAQISDANKRGLPPWQAKEQ